MKTQEEMILDYLKEHGSITSMQAFQRLGITRLSARVYDLRDHGHNVVTETVTKNGKRYAAYKLYDE